jgi:c-di-GMP-binding flagellar brake protein YcgR
MSNSVDRRIAARISVSLPITFETDDGTVHRGTIENLSESGMLVIAEDDVPIEAEVRILFGSTVTDASIELRGRVVRSSPLGAYGVAFIEVGDRAREAVRKAMMREA